MTLLAPRAEPVVLADAPVPIQAKNKNPGMPRLRESGKRLCALGASHVRSLRPSATRAVVLCYHSTDPHSFHPGSCGPDVLERHLEWLVGNCTILASDQLLNRPDSADGSGPFVLITFDDGFRDNYEYAFPLLVKYEVRASIFLVGGLLERDRHVLDVFRRIYREDVLGLDWGQVVEMQSAGFEFGAHTYSHPNLARLSDVAAKQELLQAKEVIEARIGETVTAVAYPFGKPRRHFTARTLEIAEELGYTQGFTTVSRGVAPRDLELAIPRVSVGRDSLELLQEKVEGLWDVLGWWHERAPRWVADLVSPTGRRDASGEVDRRGLKS